MIYTGRLLGYFRYPEVQTTNLAKGAELFEDCPNLPGGGKTSLAEAPEAEAFVNRLNEIRKQVKKDHVPGEVLVAVGDNFAPFLLSRRVWDENGKSLVPKEHHLDKVKYDNVACFLRLAHFDAIVPGKHDFYFGPARLRNLEEFLAKQRLCTKDRNLEPECYEPVRILGANLSLKVQNTETQQGSGGGNGQAPEIKNPGTAGSNLRIGIPKVVLPWMRAIPIASDDVKAEPTAFLCEHSKATGAGNKGAKVCDCGKKLQLTRDTGSKDKDTGSKERPERHYYWLDVGDELVQKSSYDVCVAPNRNDDAKPFGSFTVAEPFFSVIKPRNNSDSPDGEPRRDADAGEEKQLPWAVRHIDGKIVAIFGVVDPDLAEFVGRLNYTWLGLKNGSKEIVDPSYETVVNSSDPAEALNQVLQSCGVHDDCKHAHKVLLAAMPQGEVDQNLLPLLRMPPEMEPFDIVIAQVDPESATGNRTSDLENPSYLLEDQNMPPVLRRDVLERPTVLVPGSQFDSQEPYDIYLRFETATITSNGTSRKVVNHVEIGKHLVSDPFNNCQGPLDSLIERTASDPDRCSNEYHVIADRIVAGEEGDLAENTLFKDIPRPQQPADWRRGLEDVALRTMRRACDADIAMIQHRDLFVPVSRQTIDRLVGKNFNEAGIEAAVGAIFWKGDFIQCINIPGQAISSLLQRSMELQRAEDAGEYTDLSAGWALAYSGITPADPRASGAPGANGTPEWLVHGQFLDPKKLYSVAITDYLANGDTGYPELQNAQPPPDSPLNKLRLRKLSSELVCRITDIPCGARYAADELNKLDRSNQKPLKKSQDTLSPWASAWTNLEAFKQKKGFQYDEQQKPTLFVTLYKADFSYSLFQHNVNEGAIGAEFPGVTATDLSGADSESFTADSQLRIQRDWRSWELYGESDTNFGRRNQRSKSPPLFAYQPSQTADVLYSEVGGAYRLYPDYQNPSGLKLIFPSALDTELVRPYTQITPVAAKSSAGSANPVSAPRNYYWAFRPGVRFEHNFPRSQSEAGQGGPATSAQQPAQAAASAGSKGQGKSGSSQGGGQGQSQSSTWNSYIQAGYQAGEVFHSPSAFSFANPGTTLAPCSSGLVPIASLLQCVDPGGLGSNAQLTKVFANRDFFQQGLYLDFRIDLPLPGKSSAEYVFENRGDLFFNRGTDTAVETRYLNDMKHSLQLPLYGKLSVGPSVEVILFKTKVSGNYYLSYATSISLSYSFDWHPGLDWRKVLGFGSSASAPNPLPSK